MTSRDLMPFGKYKGQPLGSIPADYSSWLCRQDGFKEKSPALYKFFTEGEEAASTPEERNMDATEQALLNSVAQPFKDFWFRAYGERLRKSGPMHYIAYLRVAIESWSACEKFCAQTIIDPPKHAAPIPPKPLPADDRDEAIGF